MKTTAIFSTSVAKFVSKFARCASTAAVTAAFGLSSAAVWAETVYITVGEQAYALLLTAAPKAKLISSAEVPVLKPTRRVPAGAQPATALASQQLLQGSERVHVVEVDDNMLPGLSWMVHRELQRCGGYVHHRSLAEALTVLHRLQTPLASPAPQLAVNYALDNPVLVNALLPQLQESNLLATIQGLSDFQNRRYNSSHGVLASDWLLNRWSQLNPGNRRDVKVRQIVHAGWAQKSVEFEIIGSGNSGETLVLGAHLDSIAGGASTAETQRAPGADDDASGVAALTEIIRVMMANNYTPQRNLRFIAYAAEEVGLRGSNDIALSQALRRDRVVGVLQLDMTAFKGNPGTDIWIYTDYTNVAQNQFLASLTAAYLPGLVVGYDACGYACSDHASWTNRGFVASFPHEASNTQYNQAIHTPNDTIATFGNQAQHAIKFTRLALAYALELASDGLPVLASASAAARRP